MKLNAKMVFVTLVALVTMGCASSKQHLEVVPEKEFDKFTPKEKEEYVTSFANELESDRAYKKLKYQAGLVVEYGSDLKGYSLQWVKLPGEGTDSKPSYDQIIMNTWGDSENMTAGHSAMQVFLADKEGNPVFIEQRDQNGVMGPRLITTMGYIGPAESFDAVMATGFFKGVLPALAQGVGQAAILRGGSCTRNCAPSIAAYASGGSAGAVAGADADAETKSDINLGAHAD